MKRSKTIAVHMGLIVIGGLLYVLIELLWRHHTHWSMFPVGGLCFDIIGGIHRRLSHRGAIPRCAMCAAAVTVVELVSGCVLNLGLGLDVWDYSRLPLNICGQVCLLYTGFWMVLSGVVRPVYEVCRRGLERVIVSRDSSRLADSGCT